MSKEISDKLDYEDLKLGEKAKEAFFNGESPEEIEKKYPIYLNTREVIFGLNVTDLAIAAILGRLNSLYVGDTGTGKSQLAQDFFNYYFGGKKLENGKAVDVGGKADLDIYEEVYSDLKIEKGRWETNENVKALFHFLDEINRYPEYIQNQFLRLANGFLEHRGMKIPLGEKGYSILVATANLGNGEFGGTFGMDKALQNRFAISLDFDYEQFKPTREDRIIAELLRSANPNVKEAPIRDLSDKIIQAEKEISKNSRDLGLEAEAVINYLKFGLENCYNDAIGAKEKVWPRQCQTCNKNKDGTALCSLIKAPLPRTLNSLRKYIASLDYLIHLKDPNMNVDVVDLVFKAFELTGAYQKLLNPMILGQDYFEQNPKMMRDIVESLKQDFRKNESFILTSLEKAQKGENFDDFYEYNGEIYADYSKLNKAQRQFVKKINPFVNDREIGLGWVKDQANFYKRLNELRKNKK